MHTNTHTQNDRYYLVFIGIGISYLLFYVITYYTVEPFMSVYGYLPFMLISIKYLIITDLWGLLAKNDLKRSVPNI